MKKELIRIVVIGPESTGKSSLCEALAKHFNAHWCPEYAREYLTIHGTQYSYEQLEAIARGQLALEDSQAATAVREWEKQEKPVTPQPILFVDTDMYVMKVWCDFVFGKCHPWILEQIVERSYHLYLLCNTDLPWQKDHLREYPDLSTRESLFRIYQDILIRQPVPWENVTGIGQDRINSAIRAVDELLLTHP